MLNSVIGLNYVHYKHPSPAACVRNVPMSFLIVSCWCQWTKCQLLLGPVTCSSADTDLKHVCVGVMGVLHDDRVAPGQCVGDAVLAFVAERLPIEKTLSRSHDKESWRSVLQKELAAININKQSATMMVTVSLSDRCNDSNQPSIDIDVKLNMATTETMLSGKRFQNCETLKYKVNDPFTAASGLCTCDLSPLTPEVWRHCGWRQAWRRWLWVSCKGPSGFFYDPYPRWPGSHCACDAGEQKYCFLNDFYISIKQTYLW